MKRLQRGPKKDRQIEPTLRQGSTLTARTTADKGSWKSAKIKYMPPSALSSIAERTKLIQ